VSARAARWLLGGLLVLVTLGLYARTLSHEFVNLDDDVYVTANPALRDGLTLPGLRWAFTTGHAANWHPLTWLSHMLDVEFFDLDPGSHHATSALLHALAALLLFLWLAGATGKPFPSFLVAAFFAWHPLRAESVAWVAERKDVLSGALFFAALLAYGAWTREKSRARGLSVLVLFAAGLLAKPMLVTFPFVCLLVDLWPLGRTDALLARAREKAPLFALSLASAATTLLVQQAGGATHPLERVDLGPRLANAASSVMRYGADLLWPVKLACFYPHPSSLHPLGSPWTGGAALALALVVLASALAWRTRRARPSVFVGWCWFLGMLVPVIGLVQVGLQSHADRYTYLPSVGLGLALVFGGLEPLRARVPRIGARLGGALAIAGLGALALLAWRQIGTWRTSRTLFEHALEITRENFVAQSNLGQALESEGRLAEARERYEAALAIAPQAAPVHYQLGRLLFRIGERERAIREYRRALELEPLFELARIGLGISLSVQGQTTEAIRELGTVLDRDSRALSSADRAAAGQALAWCLATSPEDDLRDGARARTIAEESLRLAGAASPALLETLAAAAAELGEFEQAVRLEERALEGIPPSGRRAAAERLELYRSGRAYRTP